MTSPRSRLSAVLLVVATIAASACESVSDAACVPGATQACLCAGAESGAQVCEPSGRVWAACECAPDDDDDDDDGSEDAHDGGHASVGEPYDPLLSGDAVNGGIVYAETCLRCHGAAGEGTSDGPALADEVVEHDDAELWETIQQGDDDMAPIPLTPAETADVIAWLRSTFGAFEDEDEDD